MSTKSGQFVYLDDGTVAQQVQIAGTSDNTGGALGVNVKQSDAIVPVDIQNRLASTIQTHSGVSVAPSGSSQGVWMDTDGFGQLAITATSDSSSTSWSIFVYWSNDGNTTHGYETLLNSGTGTARQSITDTKARYARIQVTNGDGAAAHTYSAWTYLKA